MIFCLPCQYSSLYRLPRKMCARCRVNKQGSNSYRDMGSACTEPYQKTEETTFAPFLYHFRRSKGRYFTVVLLALVITGQGPACHWQLAGADRRRFRTKFASVESMGDIMPSKARDGAVLSGQFTADRMPSVFHQCCLHRKNCAPDYSQAAIVCLVMAMLVTCVI